MDARLANLESYAFAEDREKALKEIGLANNHAFFELLHELSREGYSDDAARKLIEKCELMGGIQSPEMLSLLLGKDKQKLIDALIREERLSFAHNPETVKGRVAADQSEFKSELKDDEIDPYAHLVKLMAENASDLSESTLQRVLTASSIPYLVRYLGDRSVEHTADGRFTIIRFLMPAFFALPEALELLVEIVAHKRFRDLPNANFLSLSQLRALRRQHPQMSDSLDLVLWQKLLPADLRPTSQASREALLRTFEAAFGAESDEMSKLLLAETRLFSMSMDLNSANRFHIREFDEYLKTNHCFLESLHPLQKNVQKTEHSVQYRTIQRFRSFLGSILQGFFIPHDTLFTEYMLEIFQTLKADAYSQYFSADTMRALWIRSRIYHDLDVSDLKDETDQSVVRSIAAEKFIRYRGSNSSYFRSNEVATITIEYKGIETLRMRMIEINTQSFYESGQSMRDFLQSELLDTLKQSETVEELHLPSHVRTVRQLSFPSLKPFGVYVLEVTGDDIQCRNVIYHGTVGSLALTVAQLAKLCEETEAGYSCVVLDEDNRPCLDGSILVDSAEYSAEEEDGKILIPRSLNGSGSKRVLLCVTREGAKLCYPDTMLFEGSSYSLQLGLMLNPEHFVSGRYNTSVFVTPKLLLNGLPADLGRLFDCSMDVVLTSTENVDSNLHYNLRSASETKLPMLIDGTVSHLKVEFTAKVRDNYKDMTLSASASRSLNEGARSVVVRFPFLRQERGRFVLEVLGHNGEAIPETVVDASLAQRGFVAPRLFTLISDARGRIELGHLTNCISLTALSETFSLVPHGSHTHSSLCCVESREVVLSYPSILEAQRSKELILDCLSSTNQYGLVEFLPKHVVRATDLLELRGLAPGRYVLSSGFDSACSVSLSVIPKASTPLNGYMLAGDRAVKLIPLPPAVEVSGVAESGDSLTIQLRGEVPAGAHFHVMFDYFSQAFSELSMLPFVGRSPSDGWLRPAPESVFLGDRKLSDENLYVNKRRRDGSKIGSLLKFPHLQINPYGYREIEVHKAEMQAGGVFSASPSYAPAAPMACSMATYGGGGMRGANAMRMRGGRGGGGGE